METEYLLPLTVLALLLALVALGFRASRRHGYGPLVVGVVSALGLALGKFVLDSNIGVCMGVAGLIAASVWNSWPKRSKGVSGAPTETLLQLGSIKKES